MARRWRVLLSLSIVLLGVGVGAMWRRLEGQAYDALTGEPLAQVYVETGRGQRYTGEGGTYSIDWIGPTLVLTFTAPGYVPLELRWEGGGLGSVHRDVWLTPLVLKGQVVDGENGAAVEGARILVGGQEVTSDSAGYYEVQRVGTVEMVRIEAPGYLPWEGEVDVVRLVMEQGGLSVHLEPTRVSGMVRAAGGGALHGAKVLWAGGETRTDEEGRFVALRVPDGGVMRFVVPGYVPEEREVSIDGSEVQVTLSPRELDLRLVDRWTGGLVAGGRVEVVEGMGEVREVDPGVWRLSRVDEGTTLHLERTGYFSRTLVYRGETSLTATLTPEEVVVYVRDRETGSPVARPRILIPGAVVGGDEEGRILLEEPDRVDGFLLRAPGYVRQRFDLRVRGLQPAEMVQPCVDDRGACVTLLATPFKAQGIYIPQGLLFHPDQVKELIELVDESPLLNAVVVDVKGDRGWVALETEDPVVLQGNALIRPPVSLKEFIEECHRRDIYVIGRVVVFKDTMLAVAQPDWAVLNQNGVPWADWEGSLWVDPFRREVWEYVIAVAKGAVELGIDEIQLDYVRFPSDGNDVHSLLYSEESTAESRVEAIRAFVAAMREALLPYPVYLSADIFGLTTVVSPEHDMGIGQRLIDIAPLVDYLCPMVYPSTFEAGNLGLEDPSAEPYETVARSVRSAIGRTSTLVRPWLQHYRYGLEEMVAQRRAAEDVGAWGWCYWNASGRYNRALFVETTGEEE